MTRNLAPALAAACLGALCLTPATAFAGKRNTDKIELARPVRSPDGDAEGVLRIKRSKKSDKVTVVLKHLDPKATYNVFDADTDELLGAVRTNRKGKAKLKLRRAGSRTPGKAEGAPVEGVAVRKDGFDAFVLVGGSGSGKTTDPDDLLFGEGFYGTLSGTVASVSLFSDGAGHDSFYASLCADTEDGAHSFEFYADTLGDDGLPLDAEGVEDLAGRAFDVVDADGDEVVSGDLPELLSFEDLVNGFGLPDLGNGERETFAAPFTLRIADDSDALTEVGDFSEIDFGFPDDFRAGFLFFGSRDGANGSITMFEDDFGSCFGVSLCIPGEEEGDKEYFDYSTDVFGGDGELPLDAEDLDELVGRDFELRNADGNAFVSGTLPELEAGQWDGFFGADGNVLFKDGEAIDPGEAPYTLFIEDENGTMTEIADLEESSRSPFPPFPGPPDDFAAGTLYFGNDSGAGGTVSLYSAGDWDTIDVSMWVVDGNSFGDFYIYAAERDGEDNDLPAGADTVDDLAGRAFEIRNDDGDVIVSDDLPELDDDPFAAPTQSNDPDFDPGPAPYTLFIADADGDLVEAGELEAFPFANLPGIGNGVVR